MELLGEPSSVWINAVTWGGPFLGFYGALVLRHRAFRNNDVTFVQRLAVAIPASLILISSFNALLREIGEPSYTSIAFVTGFVMEQGLLLDIGLARFLMTTNNDTEKEKAGRGRGGGAKG